MSGTLNIVDIAPGTRLRLKDGRIIVVTENPGDGMWVFGHEEGSTDEAPVYAGEVAGLAEG